MTEQGQAPGGGREGAMRVELIDKMGDDLSVVNAARVSFAKRSSALDDSDRRLITYLARHRHWTPFAHTAVTLQVTAPIPIRTQCFKHKIGFVENEESRRYIDTRPRVFVPESIRERVGDKKQGSGRVHPDSDALRERYIESMAGLVDTYEELCRAGVCPEQARFWLPQGVMTTWVWTGNIAAYVRFYYLRTDSHAQQEVQELARMVGEVIGPLFPVSWEALTGHYQEGGEA